MSKFLLTAIILLGKDDKYIEAEDPLDINNQSFYTPLVEVVDSHVSCLDSLSKFAPEDEKEEATPSTILRAWYLRAGLHESVGEFTEGLALLEKCQEHTPTAVDVYELKAILLKAAGDMKLAAECLDTGHDTWIGKTAT